MPASRGGTAPSVVGLLALRGCFLRGLVELSGCVDDGLSGCLIGGRELRVVFRRLVIGSVVIGSVVDFLVVVVEAVFYDHLVELAVQAQSGCRDIGALGP